MKTTTLIDERPICSERFVSFYYGTLDQLDTKAFTKYPWLLETIKYREAIIDYIHHPVMMKAKSKK